MVEIIVKQFAVRAVGFQRQRLQHAAVRNAPRHDLTGNFVGTPERHPLFHQIVRKVGGVDEAALRGLFHGLRLHGHGGKHGGKDLQAHFYRVHGVENRFLVLLHVLVVGQGQSLEGGEQLSLIHI